LQQHQQQPVATPTTDDGALPQQSFAAELVDDVDPQFKKVTYETLREQNRQSGR